MFDEVKNNVPEFAVNEIKGLHSLFRISTKLCTVTTHLLRVVVLTLYTPW